MSLTSQQLKDAFYNVLYSSTSAASVAVRAALGSGAASVIDREDMKSTLPATPFLVFQWIGRPSGGPRNRGVKTFYPIWFLYDDVGQRYFRLEALIPLVEAAYPEDVIPGCYLDFLPVRELPDPAIHLPAKSMPFEIRMRG